MNVLRRLTSALKGDEKQPSMGQSHGKESGRGSRGPGASYDAGGNSLGSGHHGDHSDPRSRRASRPDLGAILGGSSSSSRHQQQDVPFERKETRVEREARKLEKERVARIKERERSMKEEHVDGGFLVTMGIYTASEDFTKPTVRQLQIERKLAPFWRGLDDFNSTWTEHQIIAAARGIDIPPADVVPEGLVPQPRSADSPSSSLQNLNSLTVPMGPRTLSAASDKTGSNPGSSIPSPTSPGPARMGSSLKPHKAIAAALSISSRNGSQQDITPREINLPNDPFVNGQLLEMFLYKDGIECPICCMYYPRYLNKTRCCDQYICSECFVQIKRPDPHLPEHHPGPANGTDSPARPPTPAMEEAANGELIMEPACCPYCTQGEFGVIYESPPFRRGLTYAYNTTSVGALGTAMSSSSSLNSNLSPTSATTPSLAGRRRAQSLSVNATGVISTDRIRPDWSTKLANARQQQRRRAAAADALHHAAFVIGNNDIASRTLFGRSGRFGRRNTSSSIPQEGGSPGSSTPAPGHGSELNILPGMEPGPRTSSSRTGPSREHIDAAHLESMMMAEAIRLSLADEEERRKKAEKDVRKDAKKREKEERKASKRKSNVYGASEGVSSASASSLSLSLGGFGRKRGNSLRMEASVAAANASASQSHEALPTFAMTDPPRSLPGERSTGKGKGIDRRESSSPDASPSQQSLNPSLPIPTPGPTRGSSHLRQMSNASSVSSASGIDSTAGSYDHRNLEPGASGISLARSDDDDASGTEGVSLGGSAQANGTESMFNFRSLAQMVGVPIDGETIDGDGSGHDKNEHAEAHEHVEHAPATKQGSQARSPDASPPFEVTITPETTTAMVEVDGKSEQLVHGHEGICKVERPGEITQ